MERNSAYELEISPRAEKEIRKLTIKNQQLLSSINNKIVEILGAPHRFKPLRNGFAGCYRVHVSNSFVLIYEVLEESKVVRFLRFAHHDEAYK